MFISSSKSRINIAFLCFLLCIIFPLIPLEAQTSEEGLGNEKITTEENSLVPLEGQQTDSNDQSLQSETLETEPQESNELPDQSLEIPDSNIPTGNISMKIILPETFSGSRIIFTDPNGTVLSETGLDATGTADVSFAPISGLNLTVSTPPVRNVNENNSKEYSLKVLILTVLISLIISAIIFFFIGRLSCLKIIRQIREVTFDKDLD